MKRKSFVFYRSFYDGIQCLPKRERLAFFEAICQYGLDGEEPELTGATLGMFRQIKALLDDNNERFVNGKKGGAPKGNKNASKNNEKQPLVELETTTGCNQNNHYVKDEDEDEDEDEEVFGKPNDLSPEQELIRYLNRTAHRAFQFTETNLSLASSVLELYPIEAAKAVVDNKVAMWKDDPKMAGYLRPRTLFNLENFENYLNEDVV